jgi:hypothetical protein
MALILRGMLADAPPGAPLIGNNIEFYAAAGGGLLALLLLIGWLRRGRAAPGQESATRDDTSPPRPLSR